MCTFVSKISLSISFYGISYYTSLISLRPNSDSLISWLHIVIVYRRRINWYNWVTLNYILPHFACEERQKPIISKFFAWITLYLRLTLHRENSYTCEKRLTQSTPKCLTKYLRLEPYYITIHHEISFKNKEKSIWAWTIIATGPRGFPLALAPAPAH